VLWDRRAEPAERIAREHRHPDYLGDIPLPERLAATSAPEEALAAAEVVVVAVPSHALRACLEAWRDLLARDAIYVSLIKGIELDTRLRATQVLRHVLDLPYSRVVAVSGPNLAKECAQLLPSATVVASPETAVAKRIQAMSHGSAFRVYTNPDVIGVELGGAVKNAIALAAGMADGLGYGENTKATIVTRGLAETTRLGVAQGGNPLTFSGLAGVGDLVVTCMSAKSRNRHVGEELGRGRALDEIISEMNMVAEGVKSSKGIAALAREQGVEMPIVEHVVKVCHEGMVPEDMAAALMGREPKPEFHGLDGLS
jgi:glycerol-3-phosphate dehydrogenase (NAD(P)+)